MVYLIIILIGIILYELPTLIKQKLYKELIVFLVLIIASLFSGYIYYSDPLVNNSISKMLLDVFK